MKKFVRIFLFVELFVFFVTVVKDLEALTTVNPLFGDSRTPEEWRWFWVTEVLPFVSLALATVYTFFHTRKNGYMLAIAAVLYSVFLLVSEPIRQHSRYVCAPQVVTAVTVVMYLICVLVPKLPYRRKLAAGAMAVLALSMMVVYLVNEGGFDNVIDWGLLYMPPVIAFSLLGYTLPEK